MGGFPYVLNYVQAVVLFAMLFGNKNIIWSENVVPEKKKLLSPGNNLKNKYAKYAQRLSFKDSGIQA